MSKIAFFNVPAHGHINPSLPMVHELVRRGEDITVFVTPEFQTAIRATGARFQPYPVFPDGLLEDVNGNPTVLALRMLDACHRMVPGLVELLQRDGYDAVMFDSMAPWGYLAARKTGLPLISSKGLLALNPQVLLTSGLLPKMAGFILSNLGNLGRYQREAKALEQQFGLPIPAFSDMLDMPGDLTVVYTSRQFQPLEAKFPDFLYVGPSLDEREKPSDFPFDALTGAPLIYISLGTVNNDAQRFYRDCFEAFGGGAQQVVLSVGKRTPLDTLGRIPANFIVRPNVPQLQILQRAALFITHGGMNSVHEGLYYQVPLVVVPQTLEQTLVAKQVERLKAGMVLLKPNVESLRQTTQRVLNHPGYRANAASVAQGFRDAGGYTVAADAVQQFLKSKRGQPVGVTA